MNESNTPAANVNIWQLQREVWLNTKGQYIKESNTLAENINFKQLPIPMLLSRLLREVVKVLRRKITI